MDEIIEIRDGETCSGEGYLTLSESIEDSHGYIVRDKNFANRFSHLSVDLRRRFKIKVVAEWDFEDNKWVKV